MQPPQNVERTNSNDSCISSITNPTMASEANQVVAAATAALANKKTNRGASVSLTEDLYLARAWVNASEDPQVGTNLRSQEFKAKFQSNYIKFITDQNSRMGTNYDTRSTDATMKRFKKLSKCVLKMIGVRETMGPKPSGDTEGEKFEGLCEKTFCDRYPDAKNMLDHVEYVRSYLEEKPKWRGYQEEEDKLFEERSRKRKERPTGTKKAKQLEADMPLSV